MGGCGGRSAVTGMAPVLLLFSWPAVAIRQLHLRLAHHPLSAIVRTSCSSWTGGCRCRAASGRCSWSVSSRQPAGMRACLVCSHCHRISASLSAPDVPETNPVAGDAAASNLRSGNGWRGRVQAAIQIVQVRERLAPAGNAGSRLSVDWHDPFAALPRQVNLMRYIAMNIA